MGTEGFAEMMYSGEPPLIAAVMRSSIKDIEEALKRGANINARDGYGKYPIYYAFSLMKVRSEEERDKIITLVSYLITCGADLRIFDNTGRSALYYLIRNENVRDSEELIMRFINSGCNVNFLNMDRDNLLHVYLKTGSNRKIIELFKTFGGNINQRNVSSLTPLAEFLKFSDTREMNSCLDLFKYLIHEGATDFVNDVGENSMLFAIKAGQAMVVKYIIASNFSNVYHVTNNGSNGLHYAVKYSTPASSILNIMLEFIDSNTKDIFGRTPLHKVVLENIPFAQCTAEKLLQHKADVNAKDAYNMTPLQYAIQKQNFEMTKFLIRRRARCFDM